MPREGGSSRRRRRSSSRGHQRASQGQQRPSRPSELYTLLLRHVPLGYDWQEVKDEIRRYAPYHLNGTCNFDDSLPGIFSVEIRDREEAYNAYRQLTATGFRGQRIQVCLTKGIEAVRVEGPMTSPGPAPLEPLRPIAIPDRRHVNQLIMYNPMPMPHVVPAPLLYPAPMIPNYAPMCRHSAAAGNMNELTRTMQGVNLNDNLRHRRPDKPPVVRPARHRPSSSAPSRVAPPPSAPKRDNRPSRDGPLVIDGSRRRNSDSDSDSE